MIQRELGQLYNIHKRVGGADYSQVKKLYRKGKLDYDVDMQRIPKSGQNQELKALKEALAEKIMETWEPNFYYLNQQQKLKYIRLAIIDDPVVASLYTAAEPLVTAAASSLGNTAYDYISGWWNGSPADSTGNTQAIVPYNPNSASSQISNSSTPSLWSTISQSLLGNPTVSKVSGQGEMLMQQSVKSQSNMMYEENKYHYDAINV